jgi:hypothetical protein
MPAYSLGEILRQTAQLQPKTKSTKSRDRLTEKARTIAVRYGEALSKATTEEQRAAIEAAHAKCSPRIAHHRRSFFGPAPAQRMGYGQADEIMAAFYRVRDELWQKRLKGQQRLPDTRRRVLKYLLEQAVRYGVVDPALATIARHAGCCVRTVRNCLNWLRGAKLLDWRRRIRWATNALGVPEPRQQPNGYVLAPSGLVAIGIELLDRLMGGKKYRVASPTPNSDPQTNNSGLPT